MKPRRGSTRAANGHTPAPQNNHAKRRDQRAKKQGCGLLRRHQIIASRVRSYCEIRRAEHHDKRDRAHHLKPKEQVHSARGHLRAPPPTRSFRCGYFRFRNWKCSHVAELQQCCCLFASGFRQSDVSPR